MTDEPAAVPTPDEAAEAAAEAFAPPNEGHDWDEAARATYQRLMKAADEEYPPAWRPTEPGDSLMGVLVSITPSAPTKFGPSPVVAIRLPSGDMVSLWLYHKVLRRSFERADVFPGEQLLVRYNGKVHPESGGNDYDDYTVVVDRPVGKAVSWSDIAERYGDIEADEEEQVAAVQAKTEPRTCPKCGFVEPNHAEGCPEDIPF